jgi:hypothetical protein
MKEGGSDRDERRFHSEKHPARPSALTALVERERVLQRHRPARRPRRHELLLAQGSARWPWQSNGWRPRWSSEAFLSPSENQTDARSLGKRCSLAALPRLPRAALHAGAGAPAGRSGRHHPSHSPDGRASCTPAGVGRLNSGLPSGAQPNRCARAVRPAKPPSRLSLA